MKSLSPLLCPLLAGLFLFSTLPPVGAAVVRRAPELQIPGAGNKMRSLASMRGQAVVLVIADQPRRGAFRKQLKYLQEVYSEFASRGVIFVAALKEPSDRPLSTNIPFAIAVNGGAVAGAYGVTDEFALVVIGPDGNIDYQTNRVATGERVRDVIQNSFSVQSQARKTDIAP